MPTNTPTPKTIPAVVSSHRSRCLRAYGQLIRRSSLMGGILPFARLQQSCRRECDGPRAAFGYRLIVGDDQHRRAQAIMQIVNQLQNLRAGCAVQIASRVHRPAESAEIRSARGRLRRAGVRLRIVRRASAPGARSTAPTPATLAPALRLFCEAIRAGAAAARRFRDWSAWEAD